MKAVETLQDEMRNKGLVTVGDLIELLEQHRPVKVPDRFAISGAQWLVHCKPCDGDNWHTWRDGDMPRECYYWKNLRPAVLKQFNLVEVDGIYDVVRS